MAETIPEQGAPAPVTGAGAAKARAVTVRVLADYGEHRADAVIDLPEAAAAAAVAAGWADASPAAVKYARKVVTAETAA